MRTCASCSRRRSVRRSQAPSSLRTLVISDLHLGAAGGRPRLEDKPSLGGLLEAVTAADRLVLLGDVVELREGPLRDALASASRVLLEVGGALGPGREIVILPGNHDHYLQSGWSVRRAAAGPPAPLGLENEVRWEPGEALGVLAAALGRGGARVWLRDDVYATHGHYLDRHTTVPMAERLGAGAMARMLRKPPGAARCPDDYEAVLAPLYAWIHAVAQTAGTVAPTGSGASARLWTALDRGTGSRGLRRRMLRTAAAGGIGAINRSGLGPVRGDLSAAELRRAGLRAMGEVVEQLSLPAEFVVFGHTHRAGPLPGDDLAEWVAPNGARLLNTGCWVHEPAFLGSRPSVSPYRAGFAMRFDDNGAPELVNLLDG
jgi:hypothetical protein